MRTVLRTHRRRCFIAISWDVKLRLARRDPHTGVGGCECGTSAIGCQLNRLPYQQSLDNLLYSSFIPVFSTIDVRTQYLPLSAMFFLRYICHCNLDQSF
jgi:hypothetical protein